MLFSDQRLSSQWEKPKHQDTSLSDLAWCIRFAIHNWASTIYAFTHRSFGEEFFTYRQLQGLAVMSGWAVISVRPEDSLPISVMMAIFVMLTLRHRAQTRAELDEEPIHPAYIGWPIICDWLPIKEEFAKLVVEPGVLIMIGWGVAQFNECLGWFLIIGSVACFLDFCYLSVRDRTRVRQLRKAEIEQRRMNELYERQYGNKM